MPHAPLLYHSGNQAYSGNTEGKWIYAGWRNIARTHTYIHPPYIVHPRIMHPEKEVVCTVCTYAAQLSLHRCVYVYVCDVRGE